MESVRRLLNNYSIRIDDKILQSITNSIDPNIKNIHITFIIDKNNKLINYGFNIYYKTDTFPFSIHSEINTIIKYYKSQYNKKLNRKQKRMIIIKISPKIQKIGISKPCTNCANFILNNMDNLNITEILYSTKDNTLISLKKNDLMDINNFTQSSAFRKYKTN